GGFRHHFGRSSASQPVPQEQVSAGRCDEASRNLQAAVKIDSTTEKTNILFVLFSRSRIF
ncbi:MAG: hypothetical protein ABTQ25_14420, partial [Nitrosomonas ureae]